ncbi:hypothetical protein H0H92_001967 [Tricholoma furcatifolium]|nr:hypothetical protein H0H92_001967 [Tricholoma furcatifolium]
MPPMITRSKARLIAKHHAAYADGSVMVSPSATGKGTHMRWTYPEEQIRDHGIDYSSPSIFPESLSSISSCSTTSDDSLLLTPDTSFERPITPESATSQQHMPLMTLPHRIPGELQPSPESCHWGTMEDIGRLVFTHDCPQKATIRNSENELRLNRIADRELESLLRQREAALGRLGDAFSMDSDSTTEIYESWDDQSIDGLSDIVMDPETTPANNM